MKIVNLETFRAMPEGTIFMKYEPCCFDGLCVKGETWEHDFLYLALGDCVDCEGSDDFIDKLDSALTNRESVPLDFECYSRDGCFAKGQLFAIYEKEDVEKMIDKLTRCLKEGY